MAVPYHKMKVYTRKYDTSSWTVNHNMETERIFVVVFDTSYDTILPQSITKISNNQVVIGWETPVEGHVSVFKISPILDGQKEIITNTSSAVLRHPFRNKKYLYQIWNDADEVILPDYARKIDKNEIKDETSDIANGSDPSPWPYLKLKFPSAFSGYVEVIRGISMRMEFVDKKTVSINHRKNEPRTNVISQVEDENNISFLPVSESRIDTIEKYISDNKMIVELGTEELSGIINTIIHGYNI